MNDEAVMLIDDDEPVDGVLLLPTAALPPDELLPHAETSIAAPQSAAP
ncbi:MAG TPA: hypothetical protein VHB69_00830 [Mycobacteriales bacterium]|nr:hypothetical protein [Mycobacteriales bacterium]